MVAGEFGAAMKKTILTNLIIIGMRKYGFIFVTLLALACKDEKNRVIKTDTLTSGTINISVDESFKPVIDECIKVYESSNPQAHIIAHYKPEVDCFKDLYNDSTSMIVVTRGLKPDESKYFFDTLTFYPGYNKVAWDAVALVMNKANTDSLYTMQKLIALLSNEVNEKNPSAIPLNVVMDGNKSTSTLRYLMDSVLRGKPLGKNVGAAKNSNDVIDFVANNEHAIGLLGVSWIGNPEDSAQVRQKNRIRLALFKCEGCKDSLMEYYVTPSQESISTGRYPLTRGIYYIAKDNHGGLATGFSNFLQYERGQLIFRRAYLFPSRLSFERRSVQMDLKKEK
jgi:phosphate transport system substrate-binding protein